MSRYNNFRDYTVLATGASPTGQEILQSLIARFAQSTTWLLDS